MFRCEEHRDRHKKDKQVYYARLRAETFAHYGGACACCGEGEHAFLVIDHVNGGGTKYRSENSGCSGVNLMARMRRAGYPPDYRLLCCNCNHAMGVYGQCPHGTLPPQRTNHPANKFKNAPERPSLVDVIRSVVTRAPGTAGRSPRGRRRARAGQPPRR